MKKIAFLLFLSSFFSLHAENRMNHHPLLTNHVVEKNLLREGFFLFDVGASGGISKVWTAFGDSLERYCQMLCLSV